jgi:putative hemolysin
VLIATIIALVVFVLASAFFSASETSLFSLSHLRLRAYARSSQPRQRLIARLMARPRELLATILMLNILVNLLVQNTSATLFGPFGGWGSKVGVPLGLTLLFGEIIPKSVALPNNERIAHMVSPSIAIFHRVLQPIRRFLTIIAAWVSHLMFFFLRREKEIAPEELRHALKTSEKHGILSSEESELVQGYLDFQEVKVKELLRPRGELLIYDVGDPLAELTHLFTDQQCSRVPVCEGGLENILGVIEATDFFLRRSDIHVGGDLKLILRSPFFVPESMEARNLWHKLREHGEELAVVVDEYGSISGLVTREDLVEVIVGEIVDRRDAHALYTRAGAGVIIASGKLELAEFDQLFNATLADVSNCVTIGGWLTQQLGYLPKAGTKYLTPEFLFHVLAAEPHRIRRIYIRRLRGQEAEKE